MKKLYFLILLVSGYINAQIVTIPDANFKSKLLSSNLTNGIAKDNNEINIILDINNDGEIQISEALSVGILEVQYSSISDLTGIESFTNLIGLDCSNNNLTSLSTQSLCNLNYINCSHNLLTSFNYCVSQYYEGGFNLSFNNFVEIDLSEFNHPIGSTGTLNVSNNSNLLYLNIKNGHDFNSCDPTYYPNNPDCLGELSIENCYNLEFVCVDENSEEEGLIIFKVNEMGISNQVQISTDCSIYSNLTNIQFISDNSILIAPNPASSIINIKSISSINSTELYDVQGRVLQTNLVNENETTINISDKSNGIYFLKITSDKGVKVEKIIKK